MENKLITSLNKFYSLDITRIVAKAKGGFLSDNMIVANKDQKFFLRKYRDKYSSDDIASIHKSKQFFFEHGIPIIMPIKTVNGDTFVEITGKFYGLFPFIEEKDINRNKLNDDVLISIAQMQAKMHLLSKDGTPKVTVESKNVWDKKKSLQMAKEFGKIISQKKLLNGFDRLARKFIRLKKKIIEENKLKFEDLNIRSDHLVHGDFHAGNLFYDDNDTVKYVFDLEKTIFAPRAFELVRSIIFICFSKGFEKGMEKAGLYLKAYHKIYPISDSEFRAGFLMRYLDMAHSFWIEEHHYLKKYYKTDVLYRDDFIKLEYFSRDIKGVIRRILKNAK
ncbi:MAG: phosphotransferase [Patescibacteria group bacterium]|jgi:homoserine kinase type II